MPNTGRTRHFAFLCVAVIAPASTAQIFPPDDFAFGCTLSYTSASPDTAPGGHQAADLLLRWEGGGSPTPLYVPAALGLLNGDELRDISHGDDVFPPFGIVESPPVDRVVVVEYSVGFNTVGLQPKAVFQEVVAYGQACRCVFAIQAAGGSVGDPGLVARQLGLNPNTDVDALTWESWPSYPVFFTVDATTAGRLAGPGPCQIPGLTTSDILRIEGPGQCPVMHVPHTMLYLSAQDEIDALAIDKYGNIVFSLTAASPYVAANPGRSAGDLHGWVPIGTPFTPPPGSGISPGFPFSWATAGQLGLDPGDNTNAVRIGDPMHACASAGTFFPCGTIHAGPSLPYAQLTISHIEAGVPHVSDGGRLRRVHVAPFSSFSIRLDNPTQILAATPLWVLFGRLGIPGDGDLAPLTLGANAFTMADDWLAESWVTGNIPGVGYLLPVVSTAGVNVAVPSGLPAGNAATFQAITYGTHLAAAPGSGDQFFLSNAITLDVR